MPSFFSSDSDLTDLDDDDSDDDATYQLDSSNENDAADSDDDDDTPIARQLSKKRRQSLSQASKASKGKRKSRASTDAFEITGALTAPRTVTYTTQALYGECPPHAIGRWTGAYGLMGRYDLL